MATLAVAKCPALTIPNTGTTSNVWKAREVYDDAEEICLHAPAALDALTFTIEVTDDPDVQTPVWRTLQDGSPPADVAPSAAGKSRAYSTGLISAGGVRLKASGAVAADRTWAATKQYRMN